MLYILWCRSVLRRPFSMTFVVAADTLFFLFFCWRLGCFVLMFAHLLACLAKPSFAVLKLDDGFAEIVLREVGPELV